MNKQQTNQNPCVLIGNEKFENLEIKGVKFEYSNDFQTVTHYPRIQIDDTMDIDYCFGLTKLDHTNNAECKAYYFELTVDNCPNEPLYFGIGYLGCVILYKIHPHILHTCSIIGLAVDFKSITCGKNGSLFYLVNQEIIHI
eukprot:163190_1